MQGLVSGGEGEGVQCAFSFKHANYIGENFIPCSSLTVWYPLHESL